MAFCTQCGATVPDATKFCTSCGAVINNAPPEQGQSAGASQTVITEQAPPIPKAPPMQQVPPIPKAPPMQQAPPQYNANAGYTQQQTVPTYSPPQQQYYGTQGQAYYPNADIKPQDGGKYSVAGVGTFFGLMLLFSIPLIGFIFCLIFALGGIKNQSARNFAIAYLIWILIFAVVSVGFFIIFQFVIVDIANWLEEYANEYTDEYGDWYYGEARRIPASAITCRYNQ